MTSLWQVNYQVLKAHEHKFAVVDSGKVSAFSLSPFICKSVRAHRKETVSVQVSDSALY